MLRLFILLIFCSQVVRGQPKSKNYKKSIIQLGVLPGLSTNGVHPGEYDNTFSVNIFTGYGHSTKYFELNGLAGYNTASSSGIHISGIANFIGGNGQVGLGAHEKYKERSKGYETNLSGFQFSGFMNYVASNTFGAQVTVGINTTSNYLIGSQFSGLFNYVGGFTIGSQVSIIGNYSKKSMSGIQLSLLFNSTKGGYSGIQVGAFNHAGIIGTLKVPTAGFGTALQIGLVNTSGDMGGWQFGILNSADDIMGWQIGMVNLGKKVKGTQVGIINIFKNTDQIDTRDGPAYGLLNFGYYFNPRFYLSELFVTNYGISTGKPMNSRVRSAFRTYYSYNEIIYSTNYNLEQDINWGVSYRAGLISFSRTLGTTTPQHFYSVMGEIGHVNWVTQDKKQLNLRYSIQVEGGIRMAKKLSWVFPFVGLSYNYLPKIEGDSPEFLAKSTGSGKLWAGYSVGVMFH